MPSLGITTIDQVRVELVQPNATLVVVRPMASKTQCLQYWQNVFLKDNLRRITRLRRQRETKHKNQYDRKSTHQGATFTDKDDQAAVATHGRSSSIFPKLDGIVRGGRGEGDSQYSNKTLPPRQPIVEIIWGRCWLPSHTAADHIIASAV